MITKRVLLDLYMEHEAVLSDLDNELEMIKTRVKWLENDVDRLRKKQPKTASSSQRQSSDKQPRDKSGRFTKK